MPRIHVLRACGNDLSRENLMNQATHLKDVEVGALLPGIRISSSPTNYHPIRQLQLMRWSGKTWELFGDVLSDAAAGRATPAASHRPSSRAAERPTAACSWSRDARWARARRY